jgi:outer membrane immunogenic protein
MNGPIVGGQIGFNWQISSLVLGLEADGQWSNQNQSTSSPSCFGLCTINETTAINWFATARARIGYAFDRILVYGTGGAAWMNASDTANATGFGATVNIASLSSSAIGYAVGAGVEAAITNNLSARVEYLFMSSSRFSATAPLPIIGGTITETATINDSIVRAGLNWRFAF